MTEDVLGVLPASEIWGLNRRRPCTLLLSQNKLVVLARGSSRSRLTAAQVRSAGLEAYEEKGYYSLPLEEVRWVQIYPSLLVSALKVQTGGGSYRFLLGRGNARKLERLLRGILGKRVRRPGED